jgi:hypothetical protein
LGIIGLLAVAGALVVVIIAFAMMAWLGIG